MDNNQKLRHSRWVDRDLLAAFAGVPCHAEFYRYVEWHNNAFIVTPDNIPSMIFYYEDYSTRFDDLTEDLLEFIELEQKGTAPFEILRGEW